MLVCLWSLRFPAPSKRWGSHVVQVHLLTPTPGSCLMPRWIILTVHLQVLISSPAAPLTVRVIIHFFYIILHKTTFGSKTTQGNMERNLIWWTGKQWDGRKEKINIKKQTACPVLQCSYSQLSVYPTELTETHRWFQLAEDMKVVWSGFQGHAGDTWKPVGIGCNMFLIILRCRVGLQLRKDVSIGTDGARDDARWLFFHLHSSAEASHFENGGFPLLQLHMHAGMFELSASALHLPNLCHPHRSVTSETDFFRHYYYECTRTCK